MQRKIENQVEREQILRSTRIGDELAKVGDNERAFFAAHGRSSSILVVKESGAVTMWEITGPLSWRKRTSADIKADLERSVRVEVAQAFQPTVPTCPSCGRVIIEGERRDGRCCCGQTLTPHKN